MMLKKLKRKFVMINLCLVGIVLLVVFAAVCANTYRQNRVEVDRALEMALSDDLDAMTEPREIGIPPEEREGTPVDLEEKPDEPERDREGFAIKAMNYTAVVVLVSDGNEGGELLEAGKGNSVINDASMNEATLKKAVQDALHAEEASGRLSELGLFYMKRDALGGTKIAFVDSAYFDAEMKESLLHSLVLFFLAMAGLMLVSILLAGMAVTPVKKAWEQQKRFVADASHELKTPLTVILANNEILLSDMADTAEERKKWIESSQEEAVHMKKLVDDLLFLARSDEDEEGKHLIKTRTDLSELMTDEALQFEPVVYEASLALSVSIEEDVYMECDAAQMKQLIRILLDNGVKYAGREGKLWLGLDRWCGKIRMAVANTGAVIPEEELEHLFQRFYRSDQARSREGGFGLGLSIAETIVVDHGGAIKVQSGVLSRMETPKGWKLSEPAEKADGGRSPEGTLFTILY